MNTGFLMYLGAGLSTGSLILGLVAGIVHAVKPENRGFRYGAFAIPFAIVAGTGGCLSGVAFGYEFLDVDLGTFLALFLAGALAGILLAACKLKFRSRSMLLVQTIPFVINYLLLPLAVWNVIYAFVVMKKTDWELPEKPNQALQTTPMTRSEI